MTRLNELIVEHTQEVSEAVRAQHRANAATYEASRRKSVASQIAAATRVVKRLDAVIDEVRALDTMRSDQVVTLLTLDRQFAERQLASLRAERQQLKGEVKA